MKDRQTDIQAGRQTDGRTDRRPGEKQYVKKKCVFVKQADRQTDRQMDGRTDRKTDARGKNNMSPTPKGGET